MLKSLHSAASPLLNALSAMMRLLGTQTHLGAWALNSYVKFCFKMLKLFSGKMKDMRITFCHSLHNTIQYSTIKWHCKRWGHKTNEERCIGCCILLYFLHFNNIFDSFLCFPVRCTYKRGFDDRKLVRSSVRPSNTCTVTEEKIQLPVFRYHMVRQILSFSGNNDGWWGKSQNNVFIQKK